MSKRTVENLIQVFRELDKLSLRELRLVEAHSKLGKLKESLPNRAQNSIGLSLEIDPDGKTATAYVVLKLIVVYEDSPETDPPVAINAKFQVRYALHKSIPKKHLEDTVQRIAILNVWPYWRELAQSMVVRMGLPPFPLPLFNVDKLGTDHISKGDSTATSKQEK